MSSIDDNVEIKLDKVQKDLILTNLDEEGKISCIKAMKVAKRLKKDPKEMSAITKSLGIRITNCELGVFGKIKFSEPDMSIYNKLRENNTDLSIECKQLWEEAQNYTLRKIGSTVKNTDLDVIHCQLGCFRLKRGEGKKHGH